jgi:hypothetical protein
VTSFVTERDGVRWRKILHLTGYDVSDAVRTTLALDISMSISQLRILFQPTKCWICCSFGMDLHYTIIQGTGKGICQTMNFVDNEM